MKLIWHERHITLSDYFEEEKNKSVGTLAGTLTESPLSPAHNEEPELIGIAEGVWSWREESNLQPAVYKDHLY
jgi:hypothetical protein